jgi:pimeloyl-ACP methyl ester carboxylesterase
VAAGSVADLHIQERGAGPAVVCIHETATTGAVWARLAAALEPRARVITYDRPGWGLSPAPEVYERTTVPEQAALAAAVIEDRDAAPAVAALELVLRRPELILGAVLVEPPLLAFLPEATDALAESAALIREAVAEGGRELALERYLAGSVGALAAGAERLPAAAGDRGPHAAASLFAEIAAVPAWGFVPTALAAASRPSVVVCGTGTPPLVREAARGLASALARSELRELGPGLPHHDEATAVAEVVIEVAEA